jgi:hypothetical protein
MLIYSRRAGVSVTKVTANPDFISTTPLPGYGVIINFFTFPRLIQWLVVWRRRPQRLSTGIAGRHVGNTNGRMLCAGPGEGDMPVYFPPLRCGVLAALAIAFGLAGCANSGVDLTQPWFRKPANLFGQTGGYQYSDLQEARRDRPIGANDLVEQNGTCAAPAAAPPAQAGGSPPPPPMPGEGVALGMSECEVVYRAGQASNIQIGRNPNGDRTAVLTFQSGPRPGIYRFERGRLMEMDSVAPPPNAAKQPAPAKKPRKHNNQA